MVHWQRLVRDRPDLAVAAALAAATFGFLAVMKGQLGLLPSSACLIAFCALVALRRRYPVIVALAASVLFIVPRLADQMKVLTDNGAFIPMWAAIFLFAFSLGSDSSLLTSIVGLAALVASLNVGVTTFSPVPEMLTIGPWLVGLLVASRREASVQLEIRARELEAEQEIFAVQSVRYERARIARELHDIVAHSVSLMVVQANAGERLASLDPNQAGEALASIGEAARQAEMEIDRLVALLDDSGPASPSAGLRIVEELVRRAQASGLAISCVLSGDIDDLTANAAETAYRITQEAITNAMKYAPGAPITIAISGIDGMVALAVTNGPPQIDTSGLETSGGHQGLIGMRNRVNHCGGTLATGATPEGGWSVSATLPRRMAHSESL